MKNKNLLIGGAVVGALLFFWWRNKNKEDQNVLKDDSLGGGGGGKALARENGGGAVMQTGVPVVVAPVTSTLRPLRIDRNISSAMNRANQLRPATIGLGSRPINVGGTTIGGSGTPNTATGIMSGNNVQSAIDRAMDRAMAGRSNFLTFDGDYAKNTGLDFEGNLD